MSAGSPRPLRVAVFGLLALFVTSGVATAQNLERRTREALDRAAAAHTEDDLALIARQCRASSTRSASAPGEEAGGPADSAPAVPARSADARKLAANTACGRSAIIASPLLQKIYTNVVTQSLSNTTEDVQSLSGEMPANFLTGHVIFAASARSSGNRIETITITK